MRTLVSFIVTSLDGFYEGPKGEFDWMVPDEEFNDFAVRQLDAAAVLGFGRATNEHMAAYRPTDQARANDAAITARMNTKPNSPFPRRSNAPTGPTPPSLLANAVTQIDAMNTDGVLLVPGSTHLTTHFAAAGVLDELRVMLCPIAIGQGLPSSRILRSGFRSSWTS